MKPETEEALKKLAKENTLKKARVLGNDHHEEQLEILKNPEKYWDEEK